jgi:CRISPR/Cas system-associated protein Cas5 (RAMP superfamily)
LKRLAKDYLSLQDVLEVERAEFRASMKITQYHLDVEVKENQRREEVIRQQETAMRRLKTKIAKLRKGSRRSLP